jgi:hypothetical protein
MLEEGKEELFELNVYSSPTLKFINFSLSFLFRKKSFFSLEFFQCCGAAVFSPGSGGSGSAPAFTKYTTG